LDPRQFVGRSPQQVEEFITEYIEPIRHRYQSVVGQVAELPV
jgi:adenylosuccinate lyase